MYLTTSSFAPAAVPGFGAVWVNQKTGQTKKAARRPGPNWKRQAKEVAPPPPVDAPPQDPVTPPPTTTTPTPDEEEQTSAPPSSQEIAAEVRALWQAYVAQLTQLVNALRQGTVPSSTPAPNAPTIEGPAKLVKRARNLENKLGIARAIAAQNEARSAAQDVWRGELVDGPGATPAIDTAYDVAPSDDQGGDASAQAPTPDATRKKLILTGVAVVAGGGLLWLFLRSRRRGRRRS